MFKKVLGLGLALVASAALALPASAMEVGTSTSTGIVNTAGCLTSSSATFHSDNGVQLTVAGSVQGSVGINLNGKIGGNSLDGSGLVFKQIDGSLGVTYGQYSDYSAAYQNFNGSQSGTTTTTSSSAFTNL